MVRSPHRSRKRRLRRRLNYQLLEMRLPLAVGTLPAGVDDPVNAQPSFTAVDPTAVLEDSGLQNVMGFATFDPGAAGETDQSVLAYFVSNLSNPALFATAPSVSTSGDLTFEAAAEAFGTSTFELAVQDDGGTVGGGNDLSEVQTFTITITSVNDAPSFAIGEEVQVNEDSGARTVALFASNFDPGPGEDGTSPASQVIHDEGVGGTSDPLSADNLNPTDVGPLAHGSNIVRGQIEAALSVGNVDVFTFTIESGFQLGGLFVLEYEYVSPNSNPNERNAFLGIDDTDSFPYNAHELDFNSNPFLDETQFIGGTVFGLDDLPDGGAGGGDILPRAGVITGSKFTPPLPAGTYTIYIQQTGPANTYALDFRVTEVSQQSILAYTITNLSDPSLFSAPPQIDSNGDLTFTPKDDASGSVTFDVTAQDDGGADNGGVDRSAAGSGTITVTSVNDAPTFTLGDEITLISTSSAQSRAGFASDFVAGPDDESDQNVVGYHVSNLSDPSLFAASPSVDINGVLTFTPSPGATGSATFEVAVEDDGGVENGGQDTSATIMATITITAPPTIEISPSGPNGAPDPADLPQGPQPTSWMSQRSDLRQITIDLPTPISTPLAGDLVLTNLGVNAAVDDDQIISLSDNQLVLSMDGTQLRINLDATQLSDGVYQLELLAAITGGDKFTVTGNATNKFYVLRGDWDGSGGVNIQDFATFAYWFGNSVPTAPDYVDTNVSGGVNIQDFSSFAANFGKSVTFPGGTPSVSAGGEAELLSAIRTLQHPNDVDGDGQVTSADATSVIGELQQGASGQPVAWSSYDVDRNGVVTPLDALRVINGLAELPTLGEPSSSAAMVDLAIDELLMTEKDSDDRVELDASVTNLNFARLLKI